MTVLFLAVLIAAAFLPSLWDAALKIGSTRPDLYLAAAAASPAAADMALSGVATDAAPRFFTLPLLHFAFNGQPVALTAPDVLALVSSAVLLVRFLAWAISPLTQKGGR